MADAIVGLLVFIYCSFLIANLLSVFISLQNYTGILSIHARIIWLVGYFHVVFYRPQNDKIQPEYPLGNATSVTINSISSQEDSPQTNCFIHENLPHIINLFNPVLVAQSSKI